jgi:hypothetical protein
MKFIDLMQSVLGAGELTYLYYKSRTSGRQYADNAM